MKLLIALSILISLSIAHRRQWGSSQSYSPYSNYQPRSQYNRNQYRRRPVQQSSRQSSSSSSFCPAPVDKAPKAVEVFYDQIIGNAGLPSLDDSVVASAVAPDWNTRPNPLNPKNGIDAGPGLEGASMFLGVPRSLLDWTFHRDENLVIGNTVFVRSKINGTVQELPPAFGTEYPLFPGVDPDKLKGKSFEILAMDIQVTDNNKIRRTWHLEDYAEVIDSALTGRAPASLDVPPIQGQPLDRVPDSLINFYDNILSDNLGKGQDDAVLARSLAEDWQVRPNNLNRVEGTGPGRNGLKQIVGLFGAIFGDTLRFKRRRAYVICDKVFMLGKITGTVKGAPPGFDEIPIFPGIPKEKLIGKSFETLFLDRHIIVDGLMAQAYHIEDWFSAAVQMLNDSPPQDFGLDEEYLEDVDQLGQVRPSF